MDIRKLSPDLSVAPQLAPEEIAGLKALGFRTVINNRPDREGEGQPESAAIEAAARAAGLDYIYQPVVSGAIGDADIETFRALLDAADSPVLAFCRTGTRCTNLWALAQAGRQSTEELLAAARGAGYDLAAIRSRIDALAGG